MSRENQMAAAQRALVAAELVRRPDVLSLGRCWALKRLHTGSVYSRVIGNYENCAKNPRPGKLTCGWHDDREGAAQALKAKSP